MHDGPNASTIGVMSPLDQSPAQAIERRAATENFPVAAWFIERRLRPAVTAYYAFARSADDIADHPHMSTVEKSARLDAFEAGLKGAGEQVAVQLAAILAAHRMDASCANDLLAAFRIDARNQGPQSLADLDAYCQLSAAPVGRFLLALHGESPNNPVATALCAALQILNHVQDARQDLELLGRCYVPRQWLAAAGISVDDLGNRSDVRKNLFALLIAHAERHLGFARPLPSMIRHRGLAAQCRAILTLGTRLALRLRASDPWEETVLLHRSDWLAAALAGGWEWIRG